MSVSRRIFLQALASTSLAHPGIALAASGSSHRVIVVGAGASGLAAAYELHRAGHDVVVLEARSRVGGRMHTLREPFDDGLYAEAGALFLTSNNPGLDYAREFGLELVPIQFRQDLGRVAHLAGHRLVAMPGAKWDWPVPLDASDEGMSIFALQSKYHRSVIRNIEGMAQILAETPPTPELQALDEISVIEFWRRNGASESAIKLMRMSYFDGYGDGVETVSALQLAREAASFAGATGSFRVKGGNDQICAELAARLDGKVLLDSPVAQIKQSDNEVTVTTDGGYGRHEISGDYAVLTAPIHVQDRIEFSPRLSPVRERAIHGTLTTDVCRVFVQTRTRFWESAGLDGTAVTDLPIASVYHATAGQDGTRGILESFSYGPRARTMAALADAERRTTTIAGMEKAYPGAADQVERHASYDWGGDSWARGGHTAFAPGQVGEFFPALGRPEGRLYFAGDAIYGVPGYSHAAFRSGIEVAAAIGKL